MYYQDTAYGLYMPDHPLPQDFRVQIPEQLPLLLQGFRKAAGLTQAETAHRLGVTQQTFSSLERNAHRMSAERLMALLSLLGVSLILRQDRIGGARGASEASDANPEGPRATRTPTAGSAWPSSGSDPYVW